MKSNFRKYKGYEINKVLRWGYKYYHIVGTDIELLFCKLYQAKAYIDNLTLDKNENLWYSNTIKNKKKEKNNDNKRTYRYDIRSTARYK